MKSNYLKAKEILSKYGQEHLLNFYDELSQEEQKLLIGQILRIDFNEILTLYHNSMVEEENVLSRVTPLSHYEKEFLSTSESSVYTTVGELELKKHTFAVVTMAGGQGTRLGYKGPKGTYPLDLKPTKKSLFQIMCEDIMRANKKYDIIIPWYIMTSEENDQATKAFFAQNSYFGYPQDFITFFKQGQLPIINTDGKLILDQIYHIKEASNGNGNVFVSMKKNGILNLMEKQGIRWVSFGGIDNVLLKNVDPLFLGMMIAHKKQIASKSIFKEQPLEKTAVYCKKDGKPAILDYVDITLELSEKKDEHGFYLYREANMLSHLMSFDAVKRSSDIPLRFHRAFKKNPFVNFEGVKQVPDKPNTFKFENFIFDAFSFFDDMLLLRVNANEEFAPIKDFTGKFNPDTAKEKYAHYWHVKWEG